MTQVEYQEIGQYSILYQLGEGASSTVFYGIDKNTQKPVSIKIIHLDSSATFPNGRPKECVFPVDREMIEKEIEIMRQIDHPNIIKLLDVFRKEDRIYLVMELAPNGTLESSVSFHPLEKKHSKKYFYQICSAVSYLHNTKHIVHRDIKSDNILLTVDYEAKLSDFGFSKKFENGDDQDKNSLMTTRCGSPMYVSPELVLGSGYDEKTDIWSLGILLFHMLTGTYPFIDDNIQRLFTKIVNSDPIFTPDIMADNNLSDLLISLLQKNSNQRPTIEEVLKHPWLTTAIQQESNIKKYWSNSINSIGFTKRKRSAMCINVNSGKCNNDLGSIFTSGGNNSNSNNTNDDSSDCGPVVGRILPAAASVMNMRTIPTKIVPCVGTQFQILQHNMYHQNRTSVSQQQRNITILDSLGHQEYLQNNLNNQSNQINQLNQFNQLNQLSQIDEINQTNSIPGPGHIAKSYTNPVMQPKITMNKSTIDQSTVLGLQKRIKITPKKSLLGLMKQKL